MGTSCKVCGLTIYIFMLFASVEIKSFVWILKSKPLVFGEDVQLSCYGSACQPNTIKKWIGGPSYKLLCYVGYTADSSKYEIEVNDTDADFGLMIKNIAVEDTYCRYTCACGLHQYTNTLDLEGVDFIYPPKYNISVLREGTYQVEIQMTVYPLPKCYITYQENVTMVNIMNTTTSNFYAGHTLRLYNVIINHTMDTDHYSCYGTLLLKCNVGKRSYTLFNQSINMCTEQNDNNMNNVTILMLLIFTIVPMCLIIGFYLWCIYRHDLLKKIKCCKQEPVELHESEAPVSNKQNSTESVGLETVGISCNLLTKYQKEQKHSKSVNKLHVVLRCKNSICKKNPKILF